METISAALPMARKIGLGLLYRLVVSVVAMASLAALHSGDMSRPSDAIGTGARWAGLELSQYIDAWVRWVAAPHRSDIITGAAILLVFFGLCHVASQARQGCSIGSGGAFLTFLGLALYMEAVGDRFDSSWAWMLVMIVCWCVLRVRDEDGGALVVACLDLALVPLYAIVLPLLMALSPNDPGDGPPSNRPSAARDAHVERAPWAQPTRGRQNAPAWQQHSMPIATKPLPSPSPSASHGR
jgi:hypothetical protein